jgi:hypothetical protein
VCEVCGSLLTFLCVRRSFFRLLWTRSVSSLTRLVRRTHEPSFTLFTQQCDHLLLLHHLLLTLCFATLPGQVLLAVLLLAHLLATPLPSSRYALCYSLLCYLVCALLLDLLLALLLGLLLFLLLFLLPALLLELCYSLIC